MDPNTRSLPYIHRGEDHVANIVSSTYPDLSNNYKDLDYLRKRAILTPTNQIVAEINDYIMNKLPEDLTIYLSSDSVCKASAIVEDQALFYSIEFLNSIKLPGLLNHKLELKVGVLVILLKNINQSAGLCNGTRLIITQLAQWVIEGKIITESHVGTKVFIPRIIMITTDPK